MQELRYLPESGFLPAIAQRMVKYFSAPSSLTKKKQPDEFAGPTEYFSVVTFCFMVRCGRTWKDYLVAYEDDDPFAWFDAYTPQPISARRGPYTVDIAYELVAQPSQCDPGLIAYYCYQWEVVDFTELTERPAWTQP